MFFQLFFKKGFITLVSSCALARLSTAMAKNTFSRVSGHSFVKEHLDINYMLRDIKFILSKTSKMGCKCCFKSDTRDLNLQYLCFDESKNIYFLKKKRKKERVMKDTVSEKSEDYKVDGRPHARLHSSLRANTIIHHLVPVLSSQDL